MRNTFDIVIDKMKNQMRTVSIRMMYEYRYRQGKTLSETAKMLGKGYTKEKVRSLETKLLRKVQRYLERGVV